MAEEYSYGIGWLITRNERTEYVFNKFNIDEWFYNSFLGLGTVKDNIDGLYDKYDPLMLDVYKQLDTLERTLICPLDIIANELTAIIYVPSTIVNLSSEQVALHELKQALDNFAICVDQCGYTGEAYSYWSRMVAVMHDIQKIGIEYTVTMSTDVMHASKIIQTVNIVNNILPSWYNLTTFTTVNISTIEVL